MAITIGGYTAQPNHIDQIKNRGYVTVVTRNSPTTYYQDRNQEVGFEYELSQMLADRLGVALNIVTADTIDQVIQMVEAGDADFAAAGLTITDERSDRVNFSKAYMPVTQQLVYNKELPKPKSIKELSEGRLLVSADTSHAAQLRRLQQTVAPTLTWQESNEIEMVEALQLVNEGHIDYTIVDSNEFILMKNFFPNTRLAFDITRQQELGWAFSKDKDTSLLKETGRLFTELHQKGTLLQLKERYYGHLEQLDYVSSQTFLRQADRRLKKYRKYFESAAEKHGIDWRLLAAIGYQESHWKPRARSFTGVRGIMMLTQVTAREVGVTNRLNPKQSIYGGAEYFTRLMKQFDEVPMPDRQWFALAAYNVGAGHLNDAREITVQQGADANKWIDVRERLPLLTKKKWYSKTTYGYARGHEPVKYVQNIRKYYDLIAWYDQPREGMFANSEEVAEGLKLSQSATTVPPLL